jgi:hypothetical protein
MCFKASQTFLESDSFRGIGVIPSSLRLLLVVIIELQWLRSASIPGGVSVTRRRRQLLLPILLLLLVSILLLLLLLLLARCCITVITATSFAF